MSDLKKAMQGAIEAGDFEAAYEIEQQLAQADAQPVDFNAMTAVKNIPESAGRYAGDIFEAVTSPVETGKAMYQLGKGLLAKAGRAYGESPLGVGVDLPKHESEAAPDAVGGALVDRYGSVDAIKQTAMDDPFGMGMDAAGLLMGGAGLIPKGATVARSAEPVGAAIRAAQKVAGDKIPKGLPRGMYERSAKMAPRSLSREQRQNMVETALREQIMPTSEGLAKVQDRISSLGNQLDGLIDEAGAAGKTIDINDIMQNMGTLRKELGYANFNEAKDLRKFDKLARDFYDKRYYSGRTTLTPREAQDFKVKLYDTINWNQIAKKGAKVNEEVNYNMASGARKAVEGVAPGVKEVNKQLGDLYELVPELGNVANRLDNANIMSLQDGVNLIFGGVAGGPAGMAGATGLSIARSPKVQARVALALERIRTKDVKWLRENAGTPEVAYALMLAERGQEAIDDPSANQ